MARQVSNRRGQAEKLLAVVHLPAVPRARVVWGYTSFGTLNVRFDEKHTPGAGGSEGSKCPTQPFQDDSLI
jgi:hypothetical protein